VCAGLGESPDVGVGAWLGDPTADGPGEVTTVALSGLPKKTIAAAANAMATAAPTSSRRTPLTVIVPSC
jgi:hypothetical protein